MKKFCMNCGHDNKYKAGNAAPQLCGRCANPFGTTVTIGSTGGITESMGEINVPFKVSISSDEPKSNKIQEVINSKSG